MIHLISNRQWQGTLETQHKRILERHEKCICQHLTLEFYLFC